MVKKKFKWTQMKVIVTILIVAFFLFILFKAGAFDKIIDQFLTTSVPSDVTSINSVGVGDIKHYIP